MSNVNQLALASDSAVLCGNGALSVSVLSTKKRWSSFLKKVSCFNFLKKVSCFKVKVSKTFEISIDYHIKSMLISQREGFFENPYYRFLEEPMLFLLAMK